MNRFLRTAAVIVTAVIISACGTVAKEIQKNSESSRSDIFTEIRNGNTTPKGFAGLTIKANIKTHLEEYYIGESKESLHGKQGYPFVINIDGQAAIWKVDGFKDSKPLYDKDGKASRDPEAGEGMKYVLEKKIRLPEGIYNLFFGLPEDDYYAKIKLPLKEGDEYLLEFKPVYRKKSSPTRISTFVRGISRYEVFLNGSPLKISAD